MFDRATGSCRIIRTFEQSKGVVLSIIKASTSNDFLTPQSIDVNFNTNHSMFSNNRNSIKFVREKYAAQLEISSSHPPFEVYLIKDNSNLMLHGNNIFFILPLRL